MLKNWIRIFLYQIKNNKFFTALNVLGLSMGIAGLIFAILYWNDEQSYNAWNPGKDNIFYTVTNFGEGNIWGSSTAALGPRITTALPEVESFCYTDGWYNNGVFKYKDKKQLIEKVMSAQQSFFSFFPYKILKGNAATALADNTGMALSEPTAKLLFGNEDPLNKQLYYDKKYYTITCIYAIEGRSSYEPAVVINDMDAKLKESEERWGSFSYALFLKLKNPADADIVKAKMEKLYFDYRTIPSARESGMTPQEYEKKYEKTLVILEPLKTLRLHSLVDDNPEGRGNLQFLIIMVSLSVLILILSIVNYVNLATASAIKRAKEVGVRKILGASKANIIRQFVFETVLTTLFAILLSLVIVELSLPHYNNFLNKVLVIHGSQFYLQLVLIFVIVVVIAGIFPAVYVSNFETLKVLKGNFGRSKSGVWLRNSMLILQFAIASFFIVGSYIVYQQVDYMSTKDLGFNGSQVIDVEYNNGYDYKQEGFREKLMQKFYITKDRLLKIKGVKQVSAGSFAFGGGAINTSGFTYKDVFVQPQNMALDFNLLEMMKIKIKEGRNLSEKFSSDTIESALLNETAVRMIKEKDPIGKEVMWNDQKLKIVGVVSDFHNKGLNQDIPPMIFFHFKTVPWMIQNVHSIFIDIDPKELQAALPEIEKYWVANVDPDYPFKYQFVDKRFARTYEGYAKQRNLFSLLNLVVIIIALFGLFALASYSIQRRMKEIAIRKTLGAETQTLLKELSKQYVVFCIIGFVIALFPAYMLLDKWLDNFAFRINISPLPFIIGFILLMVLTLIVVLSKAYQATRVNVLKYLKYE
ncbi:ABC transporter permease [Flavobacterium subsaxonicum]|uniref:Multidrug ABC transporter substrate-binding protein n=1 Tax=Flavobacterium subsaxonicum WB 4.1-42 = DSM 21790 TaxID=1121898 RepID=A0A0A2MJT9_9FLAO|nr:ABC transporter permease [Flavobacterium subsaxonicum]KGO91851.1 multidrug ABC transporter substrate-binding protein [Flavobacterium subsaxonicum WB 4.1-42 = DSM 21790]